MINHKLLCTVAAVSMSFIVSANAQTALDGKGDKPTGWSFGDGDGDGNANELETPVSNSSLPDIDKELAKSARYRVQLVVSTDRAAIQNLYDNLPNRYPALFESNSIDVVEKVVDANSSTFRLSVVGFDVKSEAAKWCVDYKAQSGEDCVVFDGEANRKNDDQKQRLADLTAVIKGNLEATTGVGFEQKPSDPIGDIRPQTVLHQFQRAWEKAEDKGSAVFEAAYCPTCVYKMNLRELMISNFELPRGEKIIGYDVGDPTIFNAEVRGDNRLAIMSRAFGTDTNINVYSDSGRVYPVYVRSLDVHSRLVPDLVFRVLDPSVTYTEVKQPKTIKEAAVLIDAPKDVDVTKVLAKMKPEDVAEGDFLKKIPFNVAELKFDGFKIRGSSDLKLMPSRVFRDDARIYIQFDELSHIPGFAAYSVFDGIDELIGSELSGNTIVIKGLADMITLKSGNSYLCIEVPLEV